MNMKKMKKFFTLSRRAEGFTLVELIVVIAILAILGGVAVPAYSGYVKKANMTADQQLVSEVAHALELYYYSHPNEDTNGYVVLSANGADGDGTIGNAAMQAVFGDSWKDSAALKYGEWTDDGVLDTVLGDAEAAKKVAKSSFMKNSTPGELVNSFSGVTDALTNMAITAQQDPLKTVEQLGVLSDAQIASLRSELGDLAWDPSAGADNTTYSNTVSNLLVKCVADEYSEVDMDDPDAGENMSGLADMAMQYAQVYAWASTDTTGQGAEVLKSMDTAISDPDADSGELVGIVLDAYEKIDQDYHRNYGENDTFAFFSIMDSLSDLSEGFDDMSTAGLYSSESITDLVNNYTNAVSAIAGLTNEQLKMLGTLPDGCIVAFLTEDGKIAVVPALSYLAG